MHILAGDIGATNTRLALFEDERLVREEKKLSRNFASLAEAASQFNVKVDRACFGVPGPVENGICKTTNLPWVVDAKKLAEELKTPHVWLLNDLEASGYGLPKSQFFTLNEGGGQKGNAALISAGTGLGEGGLYWDGKEHHPFACEGGHVDFAPRDELEMELLRYLKKKFEHVSYERILSGGGLYQLYLFLMENNLEKGPALTSPEEITERALKQDCHAATRAVDWFVSIYGSEAGNLALKFLAMGGVYVGGGIAPRILSFLKKGDFMKAFLAKGRFATLLSKIPVKIILNDNSTLLGAASYAYRKVLSSR